MAIDVKNFSKLPAFLDGSQTTLDLSNLNITPENLSDLADILESGRGRLERLKCYASALTDEHVPALLRILKARSEIISLNLGNNAVTSEGLAQLAPALCDHNLSEIVLSENRLHDEGATVAAEIIAKKPNLVSFALHSNAFTNAGMETLSQATVASNNSNLLEVTGGQFDSPGYAFTDANKVAAFKLAQALARPEALTTEEIYRIYERRPALDMLALDKTGIRSPGLNLTHQQIRQGLAEYDALLESLPRFEFGSSITYLPRAMVTPDANGYTVLDRPTAWEVFPTVCERLATQKTPLKLEHLQKPNRDGVPFIEVALRHAPLDKVTEGLRASGIQLRGEHLLDASRKATPLLDALASRDRLDGFFTRDNFRGIPAQEVKAIIGALPPDKQEKIPNKHSLLASIRRDGHGPEHTPGR